MFKYVLMSKQKKTLTINLETWKTLTTLKAELNARDLDEVIKKLLAKWVS